MNRHAKAPSAFTFGRKGFLGAALIAMAFAALFALAFASQASAGKVVDRIVSGSTSSGTTQGLFDTPRGIAVNYANVADGTTDPLGNSTDGYVYVADDNNYRIQVFSPDGTFRFMFGGGVQSGGDGTQVCDSSELPCQAGTFGDEGGEFENPHGIAINQTTGHVYVRDRGNLRVQEFEADGDFVRTWGHDVIVDTGPPPNSNGTGFEICDTTAGNTAEECKAGTSGTEGGQFANSSGASTGIAVVPAGAPNAGNVLVADPGNRRIQEFTSSGAWVRAWGWDVIVPGGTGEVVAPINEQQTFKFEWDSISQAATFAITFNGKTTPQLPYNASAAAVDSALEALESVGAGNVIVSGPVVVLGAATWTIEFTGALGLVDVPAVTIDNSNLKAEAGFLKPVTITTTAPGGPASSFEICTVAAQCKAAANSLPPNLHGAFATNNPTHLAVDSGGTVYASDSALSNRVQRFDSGETVAADLRKTAIAVAALTSTSSEPATSGLEVDPTNGNLFVARAASNIGVLELSDPDGTPAEADRHYQGSGLGSSTGIALDGDGDDLYLASTSGGHRVFAADDDGAPDAIVTVNPPTNLEAHAATFTGTVNPNGTFATTYRFQYSRNGVTWTDVAPAFDLGAGTSPIAVEGEVTGLEANAFYRVRIVTSKPFGNAEEISPELTFLTDAVGPELSTFYPQKRTDTTARLAGIINPNNLPTAYHFEYGTTTAYGSVAPVPDGNVSGGTDKLVFAEVSGLKSETTYHVRLVATNAEGTTKGQDVSFATRSAVAAAGERAYEMVTPPFKSTRVNVIPAHPEFNANLGLPSLDGNALVWATQIFPLTDDVESPQHFDVRRISRTPSGWVNRTLNTLGIIGEYGAGSTHTGVGSSGDLATFAWQSRDAILPHSGSRPLQEYTFREGTGTDGYTPWHEDTDAHQAKFGISPDNSDPALLNDSGSAMVRSAELRDLVEDPDTPSDEDPSGEQQLYGTGGSPPGGRTIYHVQSADPDDLPTAEKDLVNECTGTIADATELPARIGTGLATDTIGAQPCTESDGTPDATGTGTVTHGSPTVTGLNTQSGAFSVGQVISGGELSGLKITAVGAGTLTLSANVTAKASIFAQLTNGSNQIVVQFSLFGPPAVGQTVSGPGIPAGTMLVAIEGTTLTLSQAATATSSFTNVLFDMPGPVIELSANPQHLTSERGAGLGSGSNVSFKFFGPIATALSDDGRRVFFASPDPSAAVVSSCATLTGASSNCPPQLFVRQYDSSGENPQVRWISHSRSNPVGENGYDGAMIAGQQVAEMSDAVFQGASRDGRNVYFATKAPLTPDDPNEGKSITTGSAQDNSWDLYRYELPEDLSDDPDDGVLTRISGGPSGSADPNVSRGGFDGSAMRFLSDGGDRAYFMAKAPIAGADEGAPKGGSTAPGGTVGSNSIRNLYLFDANESGADRYRFIAQVPATGDWNECATTTAQIGRHVAASISKRAGEGLWSCFRGTPDGSHVLFSTRGQLTADDDDDVGDIYLYDAGSDELIRVTAPPPSAVPYVCHDKGQALGISIPVNDCNGQLSLRGLAIDLAGGERSRGWSGLRYENIAKGPDGVISVFFESRSELVPEDTNGNRMDVYQWRQGELSLISPGDSHHNSWFSGNSVDGRDVFFVTHKPIDPREIDPQDPDIYDARIGGGFPYTPPPTPCDVLAFQCETEATPAAAPRGATSAGLSGEGNHKPKATTKPRKCAKGKVRRKGKCVTRKAKRSQKRAAKTTGRASR